MAEGVTDTSVSGRTPLKERFHKLYSICDFIPQVCKGPVCSGWGRGLGVLRWDLIKGKGKEG